MVCVEIRVGFVWSSHKENCPKLPTPCPALVLAVVAAEAAVVAAAAAAMAAAEADMAAAVAGGYCNCHYNLTLLHFLSGCCIDPIHVTKTNVAAAVAMPAARSALHSNNSKTYWLLR